MYPGHREDAEGKRRCFAFLSDSGPDLAVFNIRAGRANLKAHAVLPSIHRIRWTYA
jgi:hypothetical protein